MGRPTKLEPATVKAIATALGIGAPIGSACRAAGIGVTTFKTWMERGRSEAEDDAPYRAFRASVKKARATAQIHALAMVRRAMPDHWQAAAWYLERTDPKRWGRKLAPPEPQPAPPPRASITIFIRNGRSKDPGEVSAPREWLPLPSRPEGSAK